jgi:hypothetical protein
MEQVQDDLRAIKRHLGVEPSGEATRADDDGRRTVIICRVRRRFAYLHATSEQAVTTGTHQAPGHDQHDPENDLTLDQLDDADDDQHHCEDP